MVVEVVDTSFGIAPNSQIDATKVLQKHHETFIHLNIHFKNIDASKADFAKIEESKYKGF